MEEVRLAGRSGTSGYSVRVRRKVMATIMPKGEKLRQAVKWISEMRKADEKASIPMLIEKAALRFNLSPKEETFLGSFYKEKG